MDEGSKSKKLNRHLNKNVCAFKMPQDKYNEKPFKATWVILGMIASWGSVGLRSRKNEHTAKTKLH